MFETLGEKRLATHLLKGFEMILFLIIEGVWEEILKTIDMNEVKKFFPSDRIISNKNKNDQCFVVESSLVMPFFHEKTLKSLC